MRGERLCLGLCMCLCVGLCVGLCVVLCLGLCACLDGICVGANGLVMFMLPLANSCWAWAINLRGRELNPGLPRDRRKY